MHTVVIMGFCTLLLTAVVPADVSGWWLLCIPWRNLGVPSCPQWRIQTRDARGRYGYLPSSSFRRLGHWSYHQIKKR
jgi:hypothetical protein